jgi:mono/diheme cytochrome c family protein
MEVNRMRRWVLIMFVVAMATTIATAQTVVGTAHDLSSTGPGAQTNVGRVCVFCHTPHASLVQGTPATNVLPLWNHSRSAVGAYTVYDSTTMNATPTDFATVVTDDLVVSNLCMSCHDGTVAVHTLVNAPNEASPVTITAGGNVAASGLIINSPNLGSDLSNDHPVNFTYDTALSGSDGELEDPATDADSAALLSAGEVQCSSCHDPHNDTLAGGPFMRVDNTDSALCTTCHIK